MQKSVRNKAQTLASPKISKRQAENESTSKTVDEYLHNTIQNFLLYQLESGEMFEKEPKEFFNMLSKPNREFLHEEIGNLDLHVLVLYSKLKQKQFDEWFDKYEYYIKELNPNENRETASHIQQTIMLQALCEAGIINLNLIHQDLTKQAKVLSVLLGRGYENTKKYLKEIQVTKYKDKYYSTKNLAPVQSVLSEVACQKALAKLPTVKPQKKKD